MLILGQKSYILGPTILKIPQTNWRYCSSGSGCNGGSDGDDGEDGPDHYGGSGTHENIALYKFDNFKLTPGVGGRFYHNNDGNNNYHGGGGGGVLINDEGPERIDDHQGRNN